MTLSRDTAGRLAQGSKVFKSQAAFENITLQAEQLVMKGS